MITYLTQLTICWMILFLGYYIFLKRETFFKYNRWYLLTGLVLGLVIPLVDWTSLFIHEAESLGHLYVAPVNTQVQQWDIYVSASPETPIWYRLLVGVYIAGGLFAALKLAKGVREILSLRLDAEITRQEGYDLVLTNRLHMPFSFMNSIYWSAELYDQSGEKERILAHESKHVSAWHSLDILFIEALCVIFWFHPMVYIYRKEIKEVHEYEADAAACVLGNKREYGKLLLNQAQSGLQLALANHFIYSQLKNRFKMMTRKPSTKRAMLKYLIAVPIIGFAALLFSFTSNENLPFGTNNVVMGDTIQPLPPPPPIPEIGDTVNMGDSRFVIEPSDILYVNGKKIGVVTSDLLEKYSKQGPWNVVVLKGEEAKKRFGNEVTTGVYHIRKLPQSVAFTEDERKNGEIFKVVEEMPRFPGCEDVEGTAKDKKGCADRKMLEFIYENIRYPAEARQKGVNGVVVLSFVVEKDGLLTNQKIIRDPGSGLGDEALRVVNMMNSMNEKWTPGVQQGNKVRVQFILPVKFEMKNIDQQDVVTSYEYHPGEDLGKLTDEAFVIIDEREVGVIHPKNLSKYIAKEDIHSMAINKKPETIDKYDILDGIVVFDITSNALHQRELDKEKYAVDAMPRFPGCEDIQGTEAEKTKCAEKKMLHYLYDRIRYPAVARENNIQGHIIASFMVKKDGTVDDIRILRDIGAGLGDEVANLLASLDNQGKWIPAMKDGQPVDIRMTLPVRFELKGENVPKMEKRLDLSNAVNPLGEMVVVALTPDASSSDEKSEKEEKSSADKLEEVVVVGYGNSSSKVEPGHNNITDSEKLNEVVVIGRSSPSSGVQLKSKDGSEANPLIILDGTKIGRAKGQQTLETLDPSTIESINVLKGETATEKYGNEGSDGVIEITSKVPEMTRGSAKLDLSQFNLYPNPASNQLNVEFDGPSGEYSLEVLDVKGATLLNKEININGRANEVMDISPLNSGPYYLLVKTGNKVASKIFVKK